MSILVVDDEESFGRLLERALRQLGHVPTVAVHPIDALEMFRASTIGLPPGSRRSSVPASE